MKSDSVLLNAEPFGFGPAAAIAQIAGGLRQKGVSVGYIGTGHTLDLQQDVGYENIYSLADWDEAILKYDVFLTAMDFEMAARARKAGIPVIIYDALAWYWPDFPDIVCRADLYLAQDFFGVRERLHSMTSRPARTVIVPPIVRPVLRTQNLRSVILDLGGLQNPFWTLQDATTYAAAMIAAVRKVVCAEEDLIIAASLSIARALDDPAVRTYSPAEMKLLLASAKYALMTPGLGNIYDAAAYGLPTVWLPPANDSQGRQLELILEHGCADAAIDWEGLGLDMDYSAAQKSIMDTITNHTGLLAFDSRLMTQLYRRIKVAYQTINTNQEGKSSRLLEIFGSGGVGRMTTEVIHFIRSQEYART